MNSVCSASGGSVCKLSYSSANSANTFLVEYTNTAENPAAQFGTLLPAASVLGCSTPVATRWARNRSPARREGQL